MRLLKFVPVYVLFCITPLGAFAGWQPVYLPHPDDESLVIRHLESSGFQGTLALSTARVGFQNFSSMEFLVLEELPSRLHPTDPRLDPFLRSAPKLFESPLGGRWIYIPRDAWKAGADLELEALGVEWILPGQVNPGGIGISWWIPGLFFALLTLVLVFRQRHPERLPLVFTALAANFLVFAFGSAALLPCAGIVLFWSQRLRRMRMEGELRSRSETPPTSRIIWESWILVLGLAPLVGSSPFTALPLLVASLLLFGLAWMAALGARYLWEKGWERMEHRLFLPIRLASEWRTWRDFAVPLLPAILLVPAFVLGGEHQGGKPQPWEVVRIENGEALVDRRPLFKEELREGIPGATLYEAHLAFQIGWPFGLEFGLPPVEGFGQPSFQWVEGRIREKNLPILKFGDGWLEAASARAGGLSLGRLLLALPRAYTLRPGSETPNSTVPTPWLLGFYFLLVLYQLLNQGYHPLRLRVRFVETNLRRQVA